MANPILLKIVCQALPIFRPVLACHLLEIRSAHFPCMAIRHPLALVMVENFAILLNPNHSPCL